MKGGREGEREVTTDMWFQPMNANCLQKARRRVVSFTSAAWGSLSGHSSYHVFTLMSFAYSVFWYIDYGLRSIESVETTFLDGMPEHGTKTPGPICT